MDRSNKALPKINILPHTSTDISAISVTLCNSDYMLEYDPANHEYRSIWTAFYLSDIKEVNTDRHDATFDVGLVISWRDTRMTCRNQVLS